jgi:HAD superfamily hydrolase (TIGR01458 family)
MPLTRCIKAVLIDLSGTLHVGNDVCGAAITALTRLRTAGVRIKFVTNTSKESKSHLVKRVNQLGFDIKAQEIHTSLSVARAYVEEKKLRPYLMLDDRALDDFSGVSTQDPNCVVVGFAPDKFDFTHMSDAFRIIRSTGKGSLIAVNKSRYFASARDKVVPGAGCFVSGLEFSTGVDAHVIGKPSASFFQTALDSLGVSAAETVMIGDDVRDDIGGAMKLGVQGILVRTGKYAAGDESTFGITPSLVADDFAEAADAIIQTGCETQCILPE